MKRYKDATALRRALETRLKRESEDITIRHTHSYPVTIPDPPSRWQREYPELAERLTETASGLPSALELLRGFWSTARDDASGTEH